MTDGSPPEGRLQARLVDAQDVVAGVGLVAGIFVSGVSLWLLVRRVRARRAGSPRPPG